MNEANRALVVGSGLLGTSVGLALRRNGWQVRLSDRDPQALAGSVARGAGEPVSPDFVPDLVVVAVPPGSVADVMLEGLAAYPDATVTDVASVKSGPLAEVVRRGGEAARVVGSHPMAGREITGPHGASAELFEGRVWVVTPLPESDPVRVELVRRVARECGASLIELSPEAHDRAVALTSHAPQVLSSLLAGLLDDVPADDVAVSGQGLRDLTRIAGSDPALWTDILGANAGEVVHVLERLRARLDDTLSALGELAGRAESGARAELTGMLAKGNAGREKIPGKHGSGPRTFATVVVAIDDRPGELGRLFAEIGAAGVSVEDVRIDHALGRPTGLVEISVAPDSAEQLTDHLGAGGWRLR